MSRKGAVFTAYGVVEGYIVEESAFSLWAMHEALRFRQGVEGEYRQKLNDAYLTFDDGTVINFEKRDKLWVTEFESNSDSERGVEGECEVGDVVALAVKHSVPKEAITQDKLLMHRIQGHSIHDFSCEHCNMGRMRHKNRRRVTGPRFDQRGGSVYMDLMGPFEEDLEGNVYDMTVLEGKCGWLEVIGLKDKSSESTNAVLVETLTELSNNTNQVNTDFGRVHTDQGGEFKGEFSKTLASLNLTHTDTGGYNSCVNPAENAQGRLQQTARAMLAACTGGQEYFRELRGVALKRAAYCLNRKQQVEGGSPYAKAWGREFEWGNSSEHVFGAKCVFLLHAHEHEKFESRGRLGVWVGRNLKSNQHLVIPIAWDCTERVWMLDKVRSVSTVKVFDNVFPLRAVPLGRVVDWESFNNFVDRIDPEYQNAPGSGDSPLDT